MKIRAYSANDYVGVMALFDSNQSDYFVPEDRADFLQFLQRSPSDFFVGTINSKIVACGGFWFPAADQASLTWGMVRKNEHNQGWGSQMLAHRIEAAKRRGAKEVVCATSQLTSAFFERHGFVQRSQKVNGFGSNIDEIVLALTLAE